MSKRPQQLDPIRAAVSEWAQTLTPPLSPPADISLWRQALIDDAPKRFTIYEPLALLPAGSFTSKAWVAELARHHHHHHDDEAQSVITTLWTLILQHLSQNGRGRCPPLTHLAINEGIPLHNSDAHDSSSSGGGGAALSENVMRSPSGLRILHGDFGPSSSSSSSSAAAAASDGPSAQDFERAFWVATKQNGIWQTWAPRWTMFSRGNVKEKARLLGFPPATAGATDAPCTATTTRQDGDDDDDDDDDDADDKGSRGGDGGEEKGVDAEEGETGGTGDDAWAVDLYAGIGYFAFCYARLGMRVLCWEINPWSVEALRRGARMNKWTVQVLPPTTTTTTTTTSTAVEAATAAQIIVFREDNQHASARIAEYRRAGWLRDVRHVNCGLLPTSRLVWACALDLGLTARRRTWLHLHENAGEGNIGARRSEIELLLRERAGARGRAADGGGGGRQLVDIRVEHVEKHLQHRQHHQ
ncbi:tRNA wybutosine-synthesizing protein 2 [Moelleriella libera RCEF 2490]|uniref:tRNA wybutosine-synthesizing protein 2 n=1 Tax=Moelleriella libera RCEF 2490 TaxID=1081109 RepID=A0A166NPT6_9HYPO|nr:tRNA wybutosine-synthesizing protein 2 [Moelleriella libera RCEF 2490]